MSLKQKTIKGLFWSFISQAGKLSCQFIITAILARLLSPNDFGLLGMATVFTGFAMIFSELGVSSALIQKQNLDERHLSSAFWLNIVAGVLLTLIFIAISPWIAKFYKKPELQPILTVIAFNYILASFTIIQQTILTRDMKFRALMIRDIVAVIISGIAGVYLAYNGFGVWSLVYQLLSFTLANSVLLWILSDWRPKFMFSRTAIEDIFNFSANLTGFNIVNYLARNVDYLLIGKFLGAQSLGYYTLAYKLMLVPLQNVSEVISKVMFPAFSKIQHDLEKVKTSYMRMGKAISLITFPMMAGLFVIAPEFVRVMYGPNWEPIIILIRIFCMCGLIQSVGTTIGNILLSQGKANLQLRLGVINTFVVIISVLFGLRWGINGVAFCYTIYSFIWVHITFVITNKLIKLRNFLFYSKLTNAYLIAFIILITLSLLKVIIKSSNIISLSMSLFFGIVFYLFMLFCLKQISFQDNKMRFNL